MAVPARMGKVGSGMVAFGLVRYGSRGTDGQGEVWCGWVWQYRMGKVGSGTVRSGLVWQSRIGKIRCVTARKGSRGTDVMGRVGCGAAGSLHWCGEVYEVWSHPVWQCATEGSVRARQGRGVLWSGRNLQRRGGVVTHVECLGSRGV
jgi:hypothetical protein